MKKVFSLFLVLVLTFGITACSSNTPVSEAVQEQSSQTQVEGGESGMQNET